MVSLSLIHTDLNSALETVSDTLADRLEARPVAVLTALSALYFVLTGYIAHSRPLWDDEFFTLYIAQAGFKGTWHALLTGADQHPPTFYWLTHLALTPFGFHHVMFRLPQIVGFWLMCLILFKVIAPKTTNLIAYFAMLFPCITSAYYYASEGRGYGLLLAAAATAYLCWEEAVAGRRRSLTIPLFAFSLAAAVCCHYYGILIAVPFAMGEVVRLAERRKTDLPLWTAFLSPLLPLVLFLPVIRSSRRYSGNFWAQPAHSQIWDTFALVFSSAGLTVFFATVIVFLFFSLRSAALPKMPPDLAPLKDLGKPQVAVILGFVGLPVFGYLLARFVTHGFVPRYVIPAQIGAAISLAVFLYVSCGHLKALQLAFFGLILWSFGMNVKGNVWNARWERLDIETSGRTVERYARMGLPVAVAEVVVFHRLTFYGPADLGKKMFFLLDPQASLKYLGHDTIERGLLDLKPWFHENVVPYRQFISDHPEFFTYGHVGGWAWLTYKLVDDQADAKLIDRQGDRLILKVSVWADRWRWLHRPPSRGRSINPQP